MGQQEIISWWLKTNQMKPLTWKEIRKGVIAMYGEELCSISSNAMYKMIKHGIFSQTMDCPPKYYMRTYLVEKDLFLYDIDDDSPQYKQKKCNKV